MTITREPASGSRELLVDALRTIERLRGKLADGRDPRLDEPIAVVGIGCRLPGGVDGPESFWRLLRDGVDAIREFPPERADAREVYDPDRDAPGKAYTISGGFLDEVDRFEPEVFGISPREALGMDPQQRIALEVCWEALERAGYAPDTLVGSRTGVYLGLSTTDYVRLRQQTGDIRDVDAYQLTGEPSFTAGRISYVFGLRGPSKVVDTSCSSSLLAVHEACQALRLRECDAALAGGVNLMLAPYGFVIMSKFQALSPDGRCKTFDARADGYARGEGVGVVVLKRLSDAQAARDHILAVVRGSAVNHDGRSSGLTVPNPAAQQEVIRAALAAARANPADVDYVEAHGTGTALGDPIELRALDAVLGSGRPAGAPLLVGSVKTNIGHLESAAGIAGFIKVVLAIQHGEVPPHLHLTEPNPNVDWARLRIRVPVEATAWPDRGRARLAGLSSFGASGTNAHALLSSHPLPPGPSRSPRGRGLFLASARTPQALRELAARDAARLSGPPRPPLYDACFTSHVGRAQQGHGLAVVASTVDDLAAALDRYARTGRAAGVVTGELPPYRNRRLAWLFTGQGAQYPGMGRQLYAEPAFRRAFDRCAELLELELPEPLAAVVWPEPDGPSSLDETRHTQPALFALEYALAELWSAWGVRPGACSGHSVGEIAAACVAGVLSLPDAVTLVAARARLMGALPPGGAMAAVFCDEQTARSAIAGQADRLAVAAVNGPAEVVLSGAAPDLDAALDRLRGQRVRGRRLAVSHAFHSPLIEPMLDEFRRVLAGLEYSSPRIPLVSNVTGRFWTADEVGPEYWVRHAAESVRFADGVRTLHAEGFRTFLELGPGAVLSGLAARAVGEGAEGCAFVPSLKSKQDDHGDVLRALGTLCVRGTRPDWTAFHAVEDVSRIPLATTVWRGCSYWFKPARPAAAPAAGNGTGDAGEPVAGLGLRLRSAVPTYQLSIMDQPGLAGAPEVDGVPFLPAGVLVELAGRAARDAVGGAFTAAEDLVVAEPLPLSGPGAGTAQLVLTRAGDDRVRFELLSLTAAEEATGAAWRRHASGVLCRRSAVPAAPVAEQAALLDRAVGALAREAGPLQPGRPSAVTRCAELFCADPRRVRQVRVASMAVAGQSATGSVEFLAADGSTAGLARDLVIAPLPATPAGAAWRHPDELFYTVDWRSLPDSQPELDRIAGQGILLLADQHGLADRLARALRAAGAKVSVAEPPVVTDGGTTQPDDEALGALLARWRSDTARPDRVVLLTGLDAPAPKHADGWALAGYAGRADLLAVALVRRLADGPGATRLTLVTRGAVPASGGDPVNPTAATLWGLGRVLALEHPERWGGVVDLPPVPADGEVDELVRVLADFGRDAKLGAGVAAAEDELALRDGGRRAPRLVAARPDRAALAQQPRVRPDGTYLVTGGLGGIGLAVARWLAEASAGRLVLLARTPLPDRSTWDSLSDLCPPAGNLRPGIAGTVAERIAAVRALERFGTPVEVVAGDVTDEAAMAALVARLAADPLPLRGVCHAAGVSGPQLVGEATAAEYARVWRPKVIGGWLLHQLTRAVPLDFFLGFSSIASVWGSQHLASYAAGNAFLDGLAHHRAVDGLPAVTVNWGPWDLPSSLFGAEVMDFLKATGLRPLAPAQCLRLLRPLLAGALGAQPVVCAADWAVYRPVMEARIARPMLSTIEVEEDDHAGDEQPGELLVRLREIGQGAQADGAAAGAAQLRLLAGYLRDVLAGVLGTDPERLDERARVVEYGLDSLMVMEVVRRCRRDLRLTVRAGDLFERETLAEWAELLAGELDLPAPAARPATADVPAAADGPAPAAQPATADGPWNPAWIARRVTLDPRIRPPAQPVRRPAQPAEVLLTGATGFVGGYLLHELLTATDATVHCLVRCADPAEGLARIRSNVEQYLPWPARADGRVNVVPGDLGRPHLGLSPVEFDALGDRVGGIYHAGAWVNFSYTYEQLRAANLGGTEEILRLACQGRPSLVHHISTYGIWGLPADDRTRIAEGDDIAGSGRLVTGYVQTKWAAERLVELARERGIPVDVYRPGRVLGDSRTGACLTTHFTTRVIKGCIQLGMAPAIDIEVEMTPVDYVARALVQISLAGPAPGGTYHLVNGHKMRFVELAERLAERGWPVRLVPVDDWWRALREGYAVRPNELHPVMEVVEEFVVGGEEAIRYDVTRTEEALRGTGIECPPLDGGLLDTYLTWLVGSGYLPAPDVKRGSPR